MKKKNHKNTKTTRNTSIFLHFIDTNVTTTLYYSVTNKLHI